MKTKIRWKQVVITEDILVIKAVAPRIVQSSSGIWDDASDQELVEYQRHHSE